MKKYKTLQSRLEVVVILFVVVLGLSFIGYLSLEKEERYINGEISTTLKSERLIDNIEKEVYYQKVNGTDSRAIINQYFNELTNNYDNKYNHEILEILGDDADILLYNDALIKLGEEINGSHLVKFNYEGLIQLNLTIKKKLIVRIREHAQYTKKAFQWMILGSSSLIVAIVYLLYREIIKPLNIITKSISKQHDEHLIINEIDQISTHNEISLLVDSYNQLAKRNNLLLRLNEKIYAQQQFDEVFDFIYTSLTPFIPYDRIGIAVMSNDGQSIEAVTARSKYEVKLGSGYRQKIENSSLRDVIFNHDVRIINDLDDYYQEHPYSDSTRLILEEGMKSSISLPLFHEDKAIGVVFFSSVQKFIYTKKHQQFLINIANALSTSLEKSFIFENLMISTVRGFAKIVESKDNITGNHIDRIGHYSEFVAKILVAEYEEVDEKFIKSIKRLSPLHDIGKVGIADSILNKPSKLTVDEMNTMKTHSLDGALILEELLVSIGTKEFEMAVDIAKYHHEKVNGMGYPFGLSGNDIPLSARIVALTDVFDALTSERPYKKAYSFEETMHIINKDAGMHFDGLIVSTLMNNLEGFERLYNSLWA